MTLFPAKTVSRKEGLRAKARDDFEVFCHCRMPELRDISMIECSNVSSGFTVLVKMCHKRHWTA